MGTATRPGPGPGGVYSREPCPFPFPWWRCQPQQQSRVLVEATELARPDARPAGPSRGRPGARPGPHITGGRRSHVPTEGAVPSFTLRGGDNCHSNDAGREAPGLSSEGRGRAGLTPARAPATVTCDLRRARGRVLPSCSGSASAESGLSPARAAQGDRTGGRGVLTAASPPWPPSPPRWGSAVTAGSPPGSAFSGGTRALSAGASAGSPHPRPGTLRCV